jgi:hypothetical protein
MAEAPATAQNGRMPRTGLRVKLREAWRTAELDELLAHGEDPMASGELTLRALKLCDPAQRARLARSLELVVDHVSAGGPSPVPGPTILRREPVMENRAELLTLARRLSSDGIHCLRGLAMADRMIRFGDSPLYLAPNPQRLRRRVENILAALEPEDQAATPLHKDDPWPM